LSEIGAASSVPDPSYTPTTSFSTSRTLPWPAHIPWSGGSRSNMFTFSLSRASSPLKLAATLNGEAAEGAATWVGFVGCTFGAEFGPSASLPRNCDETLRIVGRSARWGPADGVDLDARVWNGPTCEKRWIVRTVVDPEAIATLVPSPVTPMAEARMASVRMEKSRRRGFTNPPF